MNRRESRESQETSNVKDRKNHVLKGRDYRRDHESNFPVIYFLFYVYISIEFIRPQSFVPALGVIRPALIAGIVMIVFSLLRLRDPVYKLSTIKLLGILVGLAALSVLYATNTHWAFQYTQLLVLYLFAVIVPAYILINSLERFRTLIVFWVLVHGYLALYCLTHGGTGPGSFLADENDMALTLNVALPFAYFLWLSNSIKGLMRWVIGTSAVLMVVGIVVSASRGGFVGLAITAIAVIWFSEKRVRNAILVGLCAGLFYLSIPAGYKQEIQSITDTEDGTRVERFYSWERGWEMFLDNPILGVGVGNFPWRFSEYELKSEDYDGVGRLHGGRAAHSLYFTLLPEMGLTGTTVFVLLLLQFFHRLRAKDESPESEHNTEHSKFCDAVRRSLQVSMIGYLVTASFISVLYYPQMWYLIGFSLVYKHVPFLHESGSRAPN